MLIDATIPTLKVPLRGDAKLIVRPISWKESIRLREATRDPKTGEVDLADYVDAVLHLSIVGIENAAKRVGDEVIPCVLTDDLDLVLSHLTTAEANAAQDAAFSIIAKAGADLGN